MAVYRITQFTASDMDKASEMTEEMRSMLEGVGADFIDVVSYGGGQGMVVARYPDKETMDAASETAKQAFGTLVAAGVIEGGSINPQTGEVINSF